MIVLPDPPEVSAALTDAQAPPVPDGSAPPVRADGTRSRGGNAMAGTRARLLAGALRAVQQQGPRATTMGDVAAFGGVAKATLYNHFRTKNDVWAALVAGEVDALARECADLPLEAALEHAATRLSAHPALRRLAADDPAALASLATGSQAAGWQVARQAVRRSLAAAGVGGDDVVLRWLSSHLTTPASADAIRESVGTLMAGLSPRTANPVLRGSSAAAERS